ncbi:hypothetical protein EYF80_032908 [Liparis tanakae]|uniref:Uncharacterized protein n=1 Tax=Liparis tanakae TaxID=230148 RepID=A0A4Z2GTE6_9TELE|nr:hypothetical protein EYF80_032908 [Liparis tanakae]
MSDSSLSHCLNSRWPSGSWAQIMRHVSAPPTVTRRPSSNPASRLTFTGYLKSLTYPKSSPVASTFLSLLRQAAVTSVTSLIKGQMPSTDAPRTHVHACRS